MSTLVGAAAGREWSGHRGQRPLLPVVLASLLSACGQGFGDEAQTPRATSNTTVGTAADESWAYAQAYLETIRNAPRDASCFEPSAAGCNPGPRSGTPAGDAVHEWVERELRAIDGLESIQVQTFEFQRFEPRRYSIRAGDFAPAAMPWPSRGVTPPEGIEAPLKVMRAGPVGRQLAPQLAGSILYLEADLVVNSQSNDAVRSLDAAARAGALGAIVAFKDAPANQIVAQNDDAQSPLGRLPTLIVGKEDGARLAALAGSTVRLTLDALDSPAAGRNVVAFLPGLDRENVLVIGTPLNGWFLSGGERAPGAGGFVHLARRLAQRSRNAGPLPYSIWFAATGGHEVGAFGLDRFLACLPRERIAAYVHLGAGLVSQGYDRGAGQEPVRREGLSQTRTLSVSENLLLKGIVQQRFGDPVLQPLFDLPPFLFNPSEGRVAYDAGIPSLAVTGTNPYHHTPLDDESQIVRGALGPMVEAYAGAIDDLLLLDPAAIRNANVVAGGLGNEPLDLPCPSPL